MAKYEKIGTYDGLPFEFYEALMPALRDGMTNEDKQKLIRTVLDEWHSSKEARFPAGFQVSQELAEARLVSFTKKWAVAHSAGPPPVDGETQNG